MDLYECAPEKVLRLLIAGPLSNALKNLVYYVRNHSHLLLPRSKGTSHREGLSTAGLPIGKDGRVVASEKAINQRYDVLIVDLLCTLGVLVVYLVIGEVVLWFTKTQYYLTYSKSYLESDGVCLGIYL